MNSDEYRRMLGYGGGCLNYNKPHIVIGKRQCEHQFIHNRRWWCNIGGSDCVGYEKCKTKKPVEESDDEIKLQTGMPYLCRCPYCGSAHRF